MRNFALSLAVILASAPCFAGKADTIQVFSRAMQKEIKCVVITPDKYKRSKKKYPVIYLLHGYSDNYAAWPKKTNSRLLSKADELQALIVCPDGGYNSWYFDSEKDPKVRYETFISNELVNYIDANYKTINDRAGRAITGLSMGGHGALYLGIRHKNVYGAVGSTSGGVDILPFPDNWDIKKVLGDTVCCLANWQRNTVINVADDLKNGDLKLIIDCGVGDFFLEVNRRFHQKLLSMNIDHDYTERPGEHNDEYWNNSIDYQLLFFRKYFDHSM